MTKRLCRGLLGLMMCLSLAGFLPQRAYADSEISTARAAVSATPVALKAVSDITASTDTGGCYISAYNWYEYGSGQFISDIFGTATCRVEIQLTAEAGYYFSQNVSVYLNGASADFILDGGGTVLTIYRDYVPELWAPTVIKHPGGETVDPGEFASFVATATCADACAWTITSPDGKTTYHCADLANIIPGINASEDGFGKINIYGIPVELDGWKIRCTFSGPGGSANTNYAEIKVRHEEEPSPSPSPTAAPTPEPSASAAPEPSAADGEHEHEFADAWKYDGETHWHECECGEKSGEAEHSFDWAVTAKATKKAAGVERGICPVCGCVTSRALEYDGLAEDGGLRRYILLGIAAVVLIIIAVLIIDVVLYNRRRRRRRSRRR